MAKVTLEAALVERIIEGYGFVASEGYKTQAGEDAKAYYTVWAKDKVAVGDIVSVEGDLTVKLSEYTNKVTQQLTNKAEANINNAKLMQSNDAPF
jgi:hypothetical protein